jgi:hypothetical protein
VSRGVCWGLWASVGVRDWRLLFLVAADARGWWRGGSRTGRSPAAGRRRRRP